MLLGLHHVTALAGQVQANFDHYTQAVGLRLVKRTVNFDDPGTYHFYFGDATGTPGTLLTFFPGFQRPSRRGAGQAVSVGYTLPKSGKRPADPDGLDLQWTDGGSPALHSVTLCERDLEPTAAFLAMLGFQHTNTQDNRHRFEMPGARIDVLHEPDTERGKLGAGAIHHVAFRVADEASQLDWRDRLVSAGVRVSPVKDRGYFHSIYFREPGGVLFEIATDGPGFLIDEPAEALGTSLCLPPWLASTRESIEARLPHLRQFAETPL
ncbi:MAG TPA: ring-cleaving dioxygenase [Bryobacteraceae bacterium]|nr:ring-cleaving dioxygenase [Bryobacteraceae bacterium]